LDILKYNKAVRNIMSRHKENIEAKRYFHNDALQQWEEDNHMRDWALTESYADTLKSTEVVTEENLSSNIQPQEPSSANGNKHEKVPEVLPNPYNGGVKESKKALKRKKQLIELVSFVKDVEPVPLAKVRGSYRIVQK
jgi:hypothetical protein